MKEDALLVSCEHGGAVVPSRYRHLFESRNAQRALHSHRGCDLGALPLAKHVSRSLGAPLRAATVTRLLVDLNRSIGHPRLFSEFSRGLDAAERERVLREYYFPHRNGVESWIEERCRRGYRVFHLGVHSFTPTMEGSLRAADVGLLYDPARENELGFCKSWKAALAETDPKLRVRRNYPYLGKADGMVTYLRAMFDESQYVGIEIEFNQALISTREGKQRAGRSIVRSLRFAMRNAKARRGRSRSRSR